MRSTFKVLFYLKRNKLQPDGKAPIMGRITVNGTIAQFSCKLNIKPDLWDTKANRAAGKSLEAQKINHALIERSEDARVAGVGYRAEIGVKPTCQNYSLRDYVISGGIIIFAN